MIDRIKCSRCGFDKYKGALYIHHKDGNHENNNLDNLEVLCSNCHFEHHHKTKRNPRSINNNKKLDNEFDPRSELMNLREENENLKNEILEYKEGWNKNSDFMGVFMERLAKEMGGFYYQNRKSINELYKKIYEEHYMTPSVDEMRQAKQRKAFI